MLACNKCCSLCQAVVVILYCNNARELLCYSVTDL